MRGWRHAWMVCALVTMTGPAWAARQHGPATGHKADVARDKALVGFQRDLVSVLAPRADALPLLGAALLARPLPNQPDHSSFHTLIDRAAKAQDAGPAIDWVRLADCDARADACPNGDALAALQAKAPDNAAVWLLKLGDDQRQLHGDAVRQDLARAAGAKLYDDYAGISLKALASTVTILPPPAATLDPKSTAGAAGLQVMMVFGSARAQPQPNLPATAKLCDDAADDATLKSDCLKLGKLLEWGSSPLARSLGLHLRETLADDPAQQDDARQARRNLTWQVQNFAALSARAQTDPAVAQHLLALARNGGNEMSLMLAALRNAGIATEAPADWKPGS
ncbi:MAG: hypothetical protein ACTHL5_06970 [Rhodanobacter sp.]